jgi:hypothetical protein
MADRPVEGAERTTKDEIRDLLSQALTVLFERAVTFDGDALRDIHVEDDKGVDEKGAQLPREGMLQDCEFGMNLVYTWDWLKPKGGLKGAVVDDKKVAAAVAYDKKVAAAVVELVRRAVERVLTHKPEDEGGEDPGSKVFFTGEPYTQTTRQRRKTFSANLDAAMLVAGFLIAAIPRFDNDLCEKDPPKGADAGAKSLRDAALAVCHAAVQYAIRCQVIYKNGFHGFTSDPKTAEKLKAAARDLDRKAIEDRIFFTWTACETINDLVEFVGAPNLKDPPANLLADLRRDVAVLATAMDQAAAWCADMDLVKQIQDERPERIAETVIEIGAKSEEQQLTDAQREQVRKLGEYASKVYPLSQYAAVRSLAPGNLTYEDVERICKGLHGLVSKDIVGASLDGYRGRLDLEETLTRYYSLGESSDVGYRDDAYYPLVVRSMSGLLSRTLSVLADKVGKNKAAELAASYRILLQDHYSTLVSRRPGKKLKDKDGKEKNEYDKAYADKYKDLWSFASSKEYVFYATQRTMFALLKYAEFLEESEKFVKVETDAEKVAARIGKAIGDSIVKALLKDANREIVTILGDWKGPEAPAAMTAPAPPAKRPYFFNEPAHAAQGYDRWVEAFSAGVGEAIGQAKNLEDIIDQCVEIIKNLHERTKDGVVPKGGKRDFAKVSEDLQPFRVKGELLGEDDLRATVFERFLHEAVTLNGKSVVAAMLASGIPDTLRAAQDLLKNIGK